MSDTRRFDPIIVDISYSSMAAGCMRIMLAGGGVELDKGGRLTGKIGAVFGRSVGVAPLLVIFSFVLRSGLTHGPQTLSRLSAAVRLRSMATTAIYSKRSVSKTSTARKSRQSIRRLRWKEQHQQRLHWHDCNISGIAMVTTGSCLKVHCQDCALRRIAHAWQVVCLVAAFQSAAFSPLLPAPAAYRRGERWLSSAK